MNRFYKFILLTLPFWSLAPCLEGTTPRAISHPSDLPEISCVPQLKKHLQAILKVPEARELINKIREDGSFRIIVENTPQSEQLVAYWDPDRRIIGINMSPRVSDGSMIGSLLFEMHNASVNSQIQHLNNLATLGRIDKAKYVESMEYLEYINSLNASKISLKGIEMGVFPQDAYLHTFPNFQEHFRVQRMSGHSDFFAQNYEECLRLRQLR